LCQKAKTGEDRNYQYFKITAYDAAASGMLTKDGRPFLDEINDAIRDLPNNVFRELYLAEATEDGSNPFGINHIAQAVYGLSNEPTVCYGIDLAKKHDWTVITGLDRHGQVSYFDRFQKDWKHTTQEILALPPGMITIDSTGVGDPIAEAIARERETELVVFGSRTKQQLMEGLAYALQAREVTILDGPMRNELESFEYEYTDRGVKYASPSGTHDDCVMSLALALKYHRVSAAYGEISVW
jgi:hypothetical protein